MLIAAMTLIALLALSLAGSVALVAHDIAVEQRARRQARAPRRQPAPDTRVPVAA